MTYNDLMHTLTVHMTKPFSHQPGRGFSLVGHVWFDLSDGQVTHNYGFHPRAAVSPKGVLDWLSILSTEGRVVNSDAEMRPKQAFMCTIPLFPLQYEAIHEWGEDRSQNGFGNYQLLRHNCVDFVWEALCQAGIHPPGKPTFEGELFPMSNIAWFEAVASVQRHRLGAEEDITPAAAKAEMGISRPSLRRSATH